MTSRIEAAKVVPPTPSIPALVQPISHHPLGCMLITSDPTQANPVNYAGSPASSSTHSQYQNQCPTQPLQHCSKVPWPTGHHSARLHSSPTAEFTLVKLSSDRIQFPHPYKRMGKTQVTITDKGLRLPRN